MKKTSLNWYVYDFRADYDAIAVDTILEIHVFNEKEWDSKKCSDLLKKCLL